MAWPSLVQGARVSRCVASTKCHGTGGVISALKKEHCTRQRCEKYHPASAGQLGRGVLHASTICAALPRAARRVLGRFWPKPARGRKPTENTAGVQCVPNMTPAPPTRVFQLPWVKGSTPSTGNPPKPRRYRAPLHCARPKNAWTSI